MLLLLFLVGAVEVLRRAYLEDTTDSLHNGHITAITLIKKSSLYLRSNIAFYEKSSFVRIFKSNTSLPSPFALVQPTPGNVTRKPLQFSHRATRSTEAILSSPWVAKLRGILKKVSTKKQVSVVFSNSDYLESVLNWLIAAMVRADPPVTNVVVFCLDHVVFKTLDERNIPSVYIDPKTVVNLTKLEEVNVIWMVRIVIFRLVNYLGYDVVSYDADAIILRNPDELFAEHQFSDVVSAAGKFPYALGRSWGFTACLGVILLRSNPRTGGLGGNSLVVGISYC